MSSPVHDATVIAASGTDKAGLPVPVIADVPAGDLVVVAIDSLSATAASLTDSQSHVWTLLTLEATSRGYFLLGALLTRAFVHATDWIKPTATGATNPVHISADSFKNVPPDAIDGLYAEDSTATTTSSYSTPDVRAGDLALFIGGTGSASGWTPLATTGTVHTFYDIPSSDGPLGPLSGDGVAVCALKGRSGEQSMMM